MSSLRTRGVWLTCWPSAVWRISLTFGSSQVRKEQEIEKRSGNGGKPNSGYVIARSQEGFFSLLESDTVSITIFQEKGMQDSSVFPSSYVTLVVLFSFHKL